MVAEAEVRAGEAARLLGVVAEVSLAVFVGVVADNLHRVLVGTHRSVGTEAEELSLEEAGVVYREFGDGWQREECEVVYDAYCEVILGFGELEVVEDGQNLGRRCVLGAETVASAHDERGVLAAVEYLFHIYV